MRQKILYWSYRERRGPGGVVGIATGYGLDGPGIESRWGRDFPHLSRPALEPIQPPDADPSPPSSAVVKKEWSYTSTPPMGHTACTEPQCPYITTGHFTFYLQREAYLITTHNNSWFLVGVLVTGHKFPNHVPLCKQIHFYYSGVH